MSVDTSLVPFTANAVPEALLAHYEQHARTLPWRAPMGSNAADPYRVWLSEIMLQQTTVAAVIPYFERFTARWPTVADLAAAPDADVMAAWAGLGYYARARNLLACARAVVCDHGGRFPDNEAALRALPGIGAYTAAAIAAIAFGQRAVVVDANVERVVSRLFAIATPLPQGRADIRAATDQITPDACAGDFAQAMMDLGAGICSVRDPSCLICPLARMCKAHAMGNPAAFPVKPAKTAKPHRTGHIWWMEHDGAVWLERRPPRGLLGGMRAFPTSDWSDAPVQTPPVAAEWQQDAAQVSHVFTHFSLTLSIHAAQVNISCIEGRDGEWWPLGTLEQAGLPTVFAKVARAMKYYQQERR